MVDFLDCFGLGELNSKYVLFDGLAMTKIPRGRESSFKLRSLRHCEACRWRSRNKMLLVASWSNL